MLRVMVQVPVGSNPAGISYSYPASSSSGAAFAPGTSVTLTATADSGSNVAWSGCDSTGGIPTAATCIVTVNSSKTVSVNFIKLNGLSFDGTNDYVTFGKAVGINGLATYKSGTTPANPPSWVTDPGSYSPTNTPSLQFNGTNQYVTFGQSAGLGVSTFTLEGWVKRLSGGTTMGTGTDGLGYGSLPQAYPILTKGRGQDETKVNNMNFFLGMTNTGIVAADFEDSNDGLNHPILGTTALPVNEWHHIAVTYNGSCWQIYIDGNLETLSGSTTQCPKDRGGINSALPESTSQQHAALATALQTTGTLPSDSGFFAGIIDEARIWNIARTQSEIQSVMNQEVTKATGLVGRWGMNEGTGTMVGDTSTPNLGVERFTLEAWVKRAAGGATMTTGSGGFDGISPRPNGAYPVLTKGMGEGETPYDINTNFFLGITVTGVVGADFEDTGNGTNRPAWGTTVVPLNEWHHIAATYDGGCWKFYLDGNVEALNSNAVACPNKSPEFRSRQHGALAAGISSTGTLGAGYFSGVIDEARVWNYARTQAEIQATMLNEITSGTGLLGRWGMSEGVGTTISDSSGNGITGTLTNGPTWVQGAPLAP